ncbi:helix-turn-helix transcriptional regulator [Aureimonas leprariae]|uniref:AraC family transcriptional regulator n=1 Tax=Plantimonas leprariae TaxID=2615207 RepID=A0A7V7TVC7_9HYPH|nr:AraC family transcriptional regulator [Aureimonas leprariae]KAB0677694.1 AraC family transcriptional regulator [Aureimonas leprariae]
MDGEILRRFRAHGSAMRIVTLARSRHRLHTMPTSTGYDVVTDPAGYRWDGRRRGSTPFTVLQHTISGTGRLALGGRSLAVGPGETMLVIIPSDHVYTVPDGGRWEFFWISMYGQEALRIHRAVQEQAGPVFRLASRTVDAIAAECLKLMDGGGTTPGEASAHAYAAQMALYDDILGPNRDMGAPSPVGNALEAVKSHVRSHLADALPVEELAQIAGFSRAHFTRLFSAAEGISPGEFVLNERMRRAARLLESGDMAVKAIAHDCGFEDPNYFAKAFRRAYGTSPTDFRTSGMYAGSAAPSR